MAAVTFYAVAIVLIASPAAGAWFPWQYWSEPLLFEQSMDSGGWMELRVVTDGTPFAIELELRAAGALQGFGMWITRDGVLDSRDTIVLDSETGYGASASGIPLLSRAVGEGSWVFAGWTFEEEGPAAAGEYTFLAFTAGDIGKSYWRVFGEAVDAEALASGSRTFLFASRDMPAAAGAYVAGDHSVRAQLAARQEIVIESSLIGSFWSTESPPDLGANAMSVRTPDGDAACLPTCFFDHASPGEYAFEVTGAGAHQRRGSDVYLIGADVD